MGVGRGKTVTGGSRIGDGDSTAVDAGRIAAERFGRAASNVGD
jgi:hypothetical protein